MMFPVPARFVVAVPRADFFVDSFVSCVVGVADAVDAIVAAPSALSSLVSFVVSQEKEEEEKKTTSVVAAVLVDDSSSDNTKGADVVVDEDVPEVIELLDDDDEVSSDEEDEVIYVRTVPAPTKVVAVSAAAPAPKSPPKATVTEPAPTKKSVTAAAPAREAPRKTTVTEPAPKKKAVTEPAPKRSRKTKTVAPAAPSAPEKRRLLKKKKTKTAPAAVVAAAAAPSPAAAKKRSRPKKTVSFGVVQVQEYSVILGDHPKCKGGYPMSLDWAHTEPKEYDLDACEQAKAAKAKAAAAREEKADGAYTDKKKSRRPGKGRRLRTKDRHLRIAKVTGIPPKEVRKLEVERQRKVHEAEHGVDLKHVGATAKKSKGKSLGGYHEV
jgi:hypothetical protein